MAISALHSKIHIRPVIVPSSTDDTERDLSLTAPHLLCRRIESILAQIISPAEAYHQRKHSLIAIYAIIQETLFRID
jgi:hypothetical protein